MSSSALEVILQSTHYINYLLTLPLDLAVHERCKWHFCQTSQMCGCVVSIFISCEIGAVIFRNDNDGDDGDATSLMACRLCTASLEHALLQCCCCCRYDAASSTRRRKRTQLHFRNARANDGGHRSRELPGVWDARRRHVWYQDRHNPTYSRCRTNGHHRRRTTGRLTTLSHGSYLY